MDFTRTPPRRITVSQLTCRISNDGWPHRLAFAFDSLSTRLALPGCVQILRAAVLCLVPVLVTSCGGAKGPSAPSESPSSETIVSGRTVDAIDGSAAVGVSVQVGNAPAVTTDGAGSFQTDVGGSGSFAAVIRSTTTIERRTTVAAPVGDLRLSLIPGSFDLDAFDQIARTVNTHLERWTTRPSLVIIVPVMRYGAGLADAFVASSEKMTDSEVSNLTTNLIEGLTLLTSGTYTSFGSTTVERPAPGDIVSVQRPGKIVIGRYSGIVTAEGTIGFATWLDQDDGSVTGGSVFLDAVFDHDDSRRRLLRIHELGHALGYQHVTSRPSIMNPVLGPEPTDFDRAAATIAFQRPPGNRAPDRDPEPTIRINSPSSSNPHWAHPVP